MNKEFGRQGLKCTQQQQNVSLTQVVYMENLETMLMHFSSS